MEKYNSKLVEQIRGRTKVNFDEHVTFQSTSDDRVILLNMIDWFVHVMDTEIDYDDRLGTEGWRHYLGVDDE